MDSKAPSTLKKVWFYHVTSEWLSTWIIAESALTVQFFSLVTMAELFLYHLITLMQTRLYRINIFIINIVNSEGIPVSLLFNFCKTELGNDIRCQKQNCFPRQNEEKARSLSYSGNSDSALQNTRVCKLDCHSPLACTLAHKYIPQGTCHLIENTSFYTQWIRES